MLKPLRGERTGHVDVFASFATPDTIVIGRYDASADPVNAAVLDENASILSRVRMLDGRPLRVARIPMPPSRGGVWRSYTKVIYANGKVLMPSYPTLDPRGFRTASEAYSRLLPEWKVIPIDCDALVEYGGALRCVSTTVPGSPRLSASSARSSESA
jgi:agmatine/peptidylarginine deiminase